MASDLLRIVESTTLDAETISSRTAQIHANVLSGSKYIRAANFTKIHPGDLAFLFGRSYWTCGMPTSSPRRIRS